MELKRSGQTTVGMHLEMAESARPNTSRAPAESRLGLPQLYEDHFEFVWRCARRMGVPLAQAEDAVQDVFLVVHRKLGDFKPDAAPRPWLFGITFRVAKDYRRRAARKGALGASAASSETVAGNQSPFDDTAKAQALQVLERFLSELDDDKRSVFVLAELEQMTAPEIAAAVDANVSTVYSRLRAARAAFAKETALFRGEAQDG